MFANLLNDIIDDLATLRDAETCSVADLEEVRREVYRLEVALTEQIAEQSPVEGPGF